MRFETGLTGTSELQSKLVGCSRLIWEHVADDEVNEWLEQQVSLPGTSKIKQKGNRHIKRMLTVIVKHQNGKLHSLHHPVLNEKPTPFEIGDLFVSFCRVQLNGFKSSLILVIGTN